MISYQLRRPNRFGDKKIIVAMVYEITDEEAWHAAYEYAVLTQQDLLLYKGSKCCGEIRFKHMRDKP